MVSFAGALCWQRGLFLGRRGSVDCEVEEQTQPRKIINIYSVGADWEQGCSGTLSAHYLSKSSAVICLEVCFAQKKKWSKTSWRVCQIIRVVMCPLVLPQTLWCSLRSDEKFPYLGNPRGLGEAQADKPRGRRCVGLVIWVL